MTACFLSLSLEYCLLILLTSEPGMFAKRPNSSHCSSLMLSSTVERFSGVRLGSGNTTGEQSTQYYTLYTQIIVNACACTVYMDIDHSIVRAFTQFLATSEREWRLFEVSQVIGRQRLR